MSILDRLALANGMRDVSQFLRSTPHLRIKQGPKLEQRIAVATRLSEFDASEIGAATSTRMTGGRMSVASFNFNYRVTRPGQTCPPASGETWRTSNRSDAICRPSGAGVGRSRRHRRARSTVWGSWRRAAIAVSQSTGGFLSGHAAAVGRTFRKLRPTTTPASATPGSWSTGLCSADLASAARHEVA